MSRKFVEASEKSLKALIERRFADQEILIVYLDGIVFGTQNSTAVPHAGVPGVTR